MQKNCRPVFVEEAEHPITGLPHPQPNLAQPPFNLRGVRIVESRSALLQQLDASDDLASNIFGKAVQPNPYGKCLVFVPKEVDFSFSSWIIAHEASSRI
jgi:hypothetical protein